MQRLVLTIVVAAIVYFAPSFLPAFIGHEGDAEAWQQLGGFQHFWAARCLLSFLSLLGLPPDRWRARPEGSRRLDLLAFFLSMFLLLVGIFFRFEAWSFQELPGPLPGRAYVFLVCIIWLAVDYALATIVQQSGLGNGAALVMGIEVARDSWLLFSSGVSYFWFLLLVVGAALFRWNPLRISLKRSSPDRELEFRLPRLVSGILPLGFGQALSILPLSLLLWALGSKTIPSNILPWITLALSCGFTIFGVYFYAALQTNSRMKLAVNTEVNGVRSGLRSAEEWERLVMAEALTVGLFFAVSLALGAVLQWYGLLAGPDRFIWLAFVLVAIFGDWAHELSWYQSSVPCEAGSFRSLSESLDVQSELQAMGISSCLRGQDSWAVWGEFAPFEHQALIVRNSDLEAARRRIAEIQERWIQEARVVEEAMAAAQIAEGRRAEASETTDPG